VTPSPRKTDSRGKASPSAGDTWFAGLARLTRRGPLRKGTRRATMQRVRQHKGDPMSGKRTTISEIRHSNPTTDARDAPATTPPAPGRSRRRLMTALAVSAPALSTALPASWARPSIRSVVTPAHAITTGDFGIQIGCAVTVLATASQPQPLGTTLDQNLILRIRDFTAADIPFEAPFNCPGGPTDPCFVLDLVTGTSFAPGVWDISLGRCQGCDDFEGFTYEIRLSCCGPGASCWLISGESETGFEDGGGIRIAELTVRQFGADVECTVAPVRTGVTVTSCPP